MSCQSCQAEPRVPVHNSRRATAARGRVVWAVLLCMTVLLALNGCTSRPSVADLYSQATHAVDAADYEGALALAEACLEEEPDHVNALILYGYCHYRLMAPSQMAEDPSPVLASIKKAAELAPENFTAQYYQGWMLYEAGEYGLALEPLERAYELRDQAPEQLDNVLVLLGACCIEQNLVRGRRYLQALRRFRGFEESPLVYNALGVLNARQLDYASALECFQDALKRDPNHPVVLQNLAVLYDDLLQRPDQAMSYYARAIASRQRMRDNSRQEAIRRRLRQLAARRRRPARD